MAGKVVQLAEEHAHIMEAWRVGNIPMAPVLIRKLARIDKGMQERLKRSEAVEMIFNNQLDDSQRRFPIRVEIEGVPI